jgi:uncharacterized LabA/DUF88 family protein
MSERLFSGQKSQLADRLIILIDGESLFQAAASLRFEVDYAKFLTCLTAERNLLHAHFYTGVSAGNHKQQAFLRWMQNNGYRIITKDLVTKNDGKRSAELAVEIATDMIRLMTQTDMFVIVSNNSNLIYAIDKIVMQGIQVSLVGVRGLTSEALIDVCDRFIDITDIKLDIQKTPKPP